MAQAVDSHPLIVSFELVLHMFCGECGSCGCTEVITSALGNIDRGLMAWGEPLRLVFVRPVAPSSGVSLDG